MASRSIDMQCWKCGVELKNLLLPFSRYEECSNCKVDLHTCMACKNYNSSVSDGCTEDRADFVIDKDKANFCDYFLVNPSAYQKQDNSEAAAARAKLAELFGEATPNAESSDEPVTALSESDKALAELKKLFGDED
jgi:hypothetical protein